MTDANERLGIIAGGGALPIAIAENAVATGTEVFLLAIDGLADAAAVAKFPHAFVSLGELGRAVALLKEARCRTVTLAGRVARPEFSKLKLDTKGVFALPRLTAAALKGDDALLRAVLAFFEGEGFRIAGSAEAARDLIAGAGTLGRISPLAEHQSDIAQAMRVVQALGALDIGQAAVVVAGLVLAVEAVEGTDAMLTRVVSLPLTLRGSPDKRMGVLVKAAKPHQERRVDLPVIGVRTIELASEAGLTGVAVEAGTALIVARNEVIAAADHHGMFLYGVERKGSP